MPSSLGSHTNDERWHEIFQDLDVAPPLPSKMTASRSNSNNLNNNTYPSTPKHSNAHQITEICDYATTRAPKAGEYSAIQHLNNNEFRLCFVVEILNVAYLFFLICRTNDGHSTDSSISERLYSVASEDELSNGSGNVSPRARRANKHLGLYLFYFCALTSLLQLFPSQEVCPMATAAIKVPDQ